MIIEILATSPLPSASPSESSGATAGEPTTPVAGVAVPALPRRIDVLAEILEDESRAALRALTVVDHRAQLRAILNAPLLVVGEVGAEVDRRQSALETAPNFRRDTRGRVRGA